MTQDELDDQLRERFIETIDDARTFAKEKRDVESLGQLAQLIGTCINWDKELEQEVVVGFRPNEKEHEHE